MSIAIVAPQKFDFQDLVCIEMMLHFHDRVGLQFHVEPDDGEDANMSFDGDSQMSRIEIQVKGASGAVTLDTIAECLAHFPNRKDSDSLFERLITDSDRFVVLVMSGRCNDATSAYLSSLAWQGDIHLLSKIKERDARSLLDVLAVVLNPDKDKDKSELKVRRHAHLSKVVGAADLASVRSALCRLIVIEQIDEGALMSQCESLLRKRHRIPNDRIDDVIAKLRSVVKSAKTSKGDAFVGICSELRKFMLPRLRPEGYVERGNERAWSEILSRSNVLLMSGSPRVGKTNASRWIAAEFEEMDYEVKEAVDFDTAKRFLLDPVDTPRLALLDDPLGGAHPVVNPVRVLSYIAALIPRLGATRKLVIAQAKDRLLAATRKAQLIDTDIAGIPWLDLGESSSAFLCELWQQLKERHDITEPLFTTVSQALQSGTLDLEAGCLQHLAVDHHRLDDPLDLTCIVRLAREDATDLGQALEQDGFKSVLMSLAIATGPGQPVKIQELAFVTGRGGNRLPGISTVKASFYGLGADTERPRSVHSYEVLPQLTFDDERILEKLELRRMIEWSEHERISFSHPFYRSAAETLLDGATRSSEDAILALLERGIFCLSPRTSRASSRNIDWIHDRLASGRAKKAVVALAISGLQSIYPSTRDICFEFLFRQLPNLSGEFRKELPKWIRQVTSISLSHVEWVDGEARLPMGDDNGNMHCNWGMSWITRDESEVAEELLLFDGNSATHVTPERAWKSLEFYESKPEKMTVRAISRLLSYDEALIRAQAVETWLSQPRSDDAEVLERIFMDDHPAIGLAALKGIVAAWHDYNSDRQSLMLSGLRKLASSPTAAATMIDRLVVFGRQEYTGEQTPWAIFEAVMPEVLISLPEGAEFNDARLFNVVDEACSHLPVESMLRIFDSWIGLLERDAVDRIPSDFELGITQILIDATKGSKELRAGRVGRLLSLHGTGALARVIADLVNAWQDLTDEERGEIVATLDVSRIDRHWLRAIVLTRRHVPLVLEQKILPDGVSLQDGAQALLQKMEPQLLDAAIKVYMGSPQPLYWIGTHHSGQNIWEAVVEQIAEDPTHALFNKAWEHISIEGNGQRVARFVEAVDAAYAEQMLERMLQIKIQTTGNFMPEAWAALLALAPDEATRSDWIKRMASHASIVLSNLSDAREWLSGENLKKFLAHLSSDITLLQLMVAVKNNSKTLDDPKFRDDFLVLVQGFFELNTPLLYGTCESINSFMQRMGYTTTDLSAIINRRKMIIEMRSDDRSSLEAADVIDCWIW